MDAPRSTLGPILFLCFTIDFFTVTSLFSVLFADDTTCLGKDKNLKDLTAYVNSELKKIANWFRSNKTAVNNTRTKFIVFRTRPADCVVVFNNNEIDHNEDHSLMFPVLHIHNEDEERNFKLKISQKYLSRCFV